MSLSQRVAQWPEQPALIDLYQLDLTPIAPGADVGIRVQRFALEPNERGQPILWDGKRWQPIAMQAEGFKLPGRGALPRPTLRLPNLAGVMSAFCIAYGDLVGAKVTRYRTFARFLPAENFVDGNPHENANAKLPDQAFRIRRKLIETPEIVEFELAWAFDLEGIMLPRRAITADTCSWIYKSAECSWSPGAGPYFDENDRASTLAGDVCSQTLTGCRKRWQGRHGKTVYMPFGGFPAVRLIREA